MYWSLVTRFLQQLLIASLSVDLPTNNMQNFTFVSFALFLLPASLMALQCYETTGTLSINNLVQVGNIAN